MTRPQAVCRRSHFHSIERLPTQLNQLPVNLLTASLSTAVNTSIVTFKAVNRTEVLDPRALDPRALVHVALVIDESGSRAAIQVLDSDHDYTDYVMISPVFRNTSGFDKVNDDFINFATTISNTRIVVQKLKSRQPAWLAFLRNLFK